MSDTGVLAAPRAADGHRAAPGRALAWWLLTGGLLGLAAAFVLVVLSVETSGVWDPGGGVVEVEAAGAVEGLLGGTAG